MSFRFLLPALCSVLLVSACAYKYDELKMLEINKESFNDHLAHEYKKLAMFEAYEMQDYKDADYFTEKAFMAADDETVMPTLPNARKYPLKKEAAIKEAYNKLLYVLDNYRTPENYAALAEAQAKYDCWIEQLEENIQPDHIAACRKEFYTALKKIKMAKKDHKVFQTYMIFFDHDSAKVKDSAMKIVNKATEIIKKHENLSVLVSGHTDTSGSEEYNETLSLKRASAVRDVLAKHGIDKDRIRILGKGESDLYRATSDGVKEARNRRVAIYIAEKL